MDKIIGQIFVTTDYSKFKKLESNRAVLTQRKNKLIESFSEHEIMNPIVINRNFEIIDGQGRYEAKKELALPIYYIIDPDADLEDCRRMNEYNSHWTIDDFINSFADEGNPNYIELRKCKQEVKQPTLRILRLANKGTKTGHNGEKEHARAGLIKFTEDDSNKVKNVLEKANDIAEALCQTKRLNDAFYVAVKVSCEFEGYDHERMLRNCKSQRSSYNQMSNLENQLKEFSRIYNHGAKRNKIYFEDYMRNRGYNVRDYEFNKDSEDISSLERRKS